MTVEEAIRWFEAMVGAGERRPGVVRLVQQGEFASILIDNPRARNAMHLGMMLDLACAVRTLRSDPPGLVVLRSSESGVFCAGGHLADVRDSLASPAAGQEMCLAMSAVLNALCDLPSLVVAVIDGPCIGGGAELATAADLRLMTSRGYLHFVQAKLGVVAGWGGVGRLIAVIGRGHAVRALTGYERLDGPRCEQMGLGIPVSHEELERWLDHLQRLSPEVARALKKQITASAQVHDAQRVTKESSGFSEVWAGQAHREALAKLPI